MPPSRFVFTRETTPREWRLGTFLEREDPLADAVIEALLPFSRGEQEALIDDMLAPLPRRLPHALQQLRDSVQEVPWWFDAPRANLGGEVLLRNGLMSGLVLAFKSLVLGYCSPGGNKPLAFSRRLTEDVNRRLSETARFVEAVSHPDGVRFGAPGFKAALRVRLIHARVRHSLKTSPRWRPAEWGAPINQYDLAGTVLLFSISLIEGLRQLGVHVTGEEEEANLHLWRYVGQLMGVDDELACTSLREARALATMIQSTQALPDEDSRRLTQALVQVAPQRGGPEASIGFGYALTRHLIGAKYADAMELPRTPWEVAPQLMKHVGGRLARVAGRVPGARAGALKLGTLYWRQAVELTLGKAEVAFALPL